MGALITVLFLAVVGWNTFTQIMARQQTSISCSYDVATARGIVSRSFGMWWKAVPGNGEDNYKSKRGSSAPTLSTKVWPPTESRITSAPRPSVNSRVRSAKFSVV